MVVVVNCGGEYGERWKLEGRKIGICSFILISTAQHLKISATFLVLIHLLSLTGVLCNDLKKVFRYISMYPTALLKMIDVLFFLKVTKCIIFLSNENVIRYIRIFYKFL